MRTSEGSSLSFLKLNGRQCVVCCTIILLSFWLKLHHTLFYSCISSSSINVVDFNSVPFPVLKVKNHPSILKIFLGVICSSYLSRSSKWWVVISALPLYVAACRRNLSSPCSFLTFPQVRESHRGLSQVYSGQYLFLEERECHKVVTHTLYMVAF